MTMILRFFAAALLVVLFAVVLGVTVANSPIIGGAAQNTPHFEPMSQLYKESIIEDKRFVCNGRLPLHCDAWEGDAEGALSSIKRWGGVMTPNEIGITPLDIAIIKHGKDSVIALVLQRAMEKKASKNRQKADELLRDLE